MIDPLMVPCPSHWTPIKLTYLDEGPCWLFTKVKTEHLNQTSSLIFYIANINEVNRGRERKHVASMSRKNRAMQRGLICEIKEPQNWRATPTPPHASCECSGQPTRCQAVGWKERRWSFAYKCCSSKKGYDLVSFCDQITAHKRHHISGLGNLCIYSSARTKDQEQPPP